MRTATKRRRNQCEANISTREMPRPVLDDQRRSIPGLLETAEPSFEIHQSPPANDSRWSPPSTEPGIAIPGSQKERARSRRERVVGKDFGTDQKGHSFERMGTLSKRIRPPIPPKVFDRSQIPFINLAEQTLPWGPISLMQPQLPEEAIPDHFHDTATVK